MKYRACFLAICVFPVASNAQSLLGIGVRAGYTISNSFTGLDGASHSLSGPEIGLDIPVGVPLPINGLGGLQFALSPSYFWGGGEGDVLRILGTVRLSIPTSQFYVRLGAGFSNANSSNGDFSSQTVYEMQLAVGVGILNSLPAVKVSAEVAYHTSSLAAVSGFTFSIGARF